MLLSMPDIVAPSFRGSHRIFNFLRHILTLCLTGIVTRSHATEIPNCTSVADKWIDNFQSFSLPSWIHRGICVRVDNIEEGAGPLCYKAFQVTQTNLDDPRKAEYAAATSALLLLPTIGALLGAPTAEIWRLLTVIPFGGVLAMTLSFGGVILPVRVKDYENDANGQRTTVGRSISSAAPALGHADSSEDEEDEGGIDQIVDIVRSRVQRDESQRLAKGHLWIGLLVMVVLWCGAQAAMIIIEQGAIVSWWCTSRWWMHCWYFMVTVTAILENRAQIPFVESWKLYVSDVPYDTRIRDGDAVLPKIKSSVANAKHILHQLGSLRAGRVTLFGSSEKTRPRNAVLVMISVVAPRDYSRARSLFRLGSKVLSITVFVTGTAIFGAAQLLALPVAVLVLTLILAAGVLSRATTAWIVSRIGKTEPLIHVIASSTEEAQRVIANILSIEPQNRGVQVELGGHIFVNQRRVASRSVWWVRSLGVLAEPFDLRKVAHVEPCHGKSEASTDPSDAELGLLQESQS